MFFNALSILKQMIKSESKSCEQKPRSTALHPNSLSLNSITLFDLENLFTSTSISASASQSKQARKSTLFINAVVRTHLPRQTDWLMTHSRHCWGRTDIQWAGNAWGTGWVVAPNYCSWGWGRCNCKCRTTAILWTGNSWCADWIYASLFDGRCSISKLDRVGKRCSTED
jgi:hypothetical protein